MDDQEQIEFLKQKLQMLRDEMPDTPLDAEKKALEIEAVEDQLLELYDKAKEAPVTKPSATLDELSEQINSITNELMELEIKALRADMNNDEDTKIKMQMCASSLKARRQELIDQVKSMNSPAEKKGSDDIEARLSALEEEVAEIKELLYQLLTKE